jgi:IS1 family transposase
VRIEVDELWSFLGEKQQVWWVWLALDSRTRQVVAIVAGDRDEFTARCLWQALPPEYRQRTIVATDLLPVYQAVVPEEWHATGGKEMGLTAHIERFFGTLRQRCARFGAEDVVVFAEDGEPCWRPMVLHPTIQPMPRIGPLLPLVRQAGSGPKVQQGWVAANSCS